MSNLASEERENYRVAESAFYEPVERFLHLRFQQRLKPLLGESLPPITAITAKVNMAGQWTRPDVGLIAAWKNRYSAIVNLDVYGFEVKTRQGCTLTAVHEALAQNRVVHYSYLVWHLPESDFSQDRFETISNHCEAFGIGLITSVVVRTPTPSSLICEPSAEIPHRTQSTNSSKRAFTRPIVRAYCDSYPR